VDNSVGKKRKLQRVKLTKGENVDDDEDDGLEVFAQDDNSTAQDETDISAFVNVIQRRGFALQSASVNKHNKMFVSMTFVKTGIPSAGNHRGLKWNGQAYERMGGPATGRKKFIDESKEDDLALSPEEESKVLKPCVYKKR
jgi:ribosomal RNA-processing protein 8